eukprot:TRINITY_DN51849_c0_g1_i1.p1 TRINITY_DN51849_c0_g1~~TRINITY_DN51849_c0_g1_i1.p1  ORF type:complete len:197 (+),score=-8.82 TRINITY_DN51849_c0_g1_i1:2-592(+)
MLHLKIEVVPHRNFYTNFENHVFFLKLQYDTIMLCSREEGSQDPSDTIQPGTDSYLQGHAYYILPQERSHLVPCGAQAADLCIQLPFPGSQEEKKILQIVQFIIRGRVVHLKRVQLCCSCEFVFQHLNLIIRTNTIKKSQTKYTLSICSTPEIWRCYREHLKKRVNLLSISQKFLQISLRCRDSGQITYGQTQSRI